MRVAVDVERVGEAVEAADLLQLLERRRTTARVEQADVLDRVRVVAHLRGGGRRLRVVLGHVDLVDAVGRPGGVDVALDVRRSAIGLGRPDLELLHDRRVDPADQDRARAPAGRARRPAAAPSAGRKTLAKNSTAQISAMTTRMFLAGRTALTSRYLSPVISPLVA